MGNAWTRKNPLMSMWLSSANKVSGKTATKALAKKRGRR